MPSFPRRRESCLIFRNYCKNNLLFKFRQDSRLRRNDGRFTVSCLILGFAKVSIYFFRRPFVFQTGQASAAPRKPRALPRGGIPCLQRQRPSEKTDFVFSDGLFCCGGRIWRHSKKPPIARGLCVWRSKRKQNLILLL